MKLLQAQDYLLFIDEKAEIQKGGYAYQINYEKTNIQVIKIESDFQEKIANDKNGTFTKYKIIGYYPLTKEAKELDLPELPPFEVNIEKLACEKYNLKKGINDYDERYYNSHNVAKAEAFIEGYKAAQAKQFSLEDMIHAYDTGTNDGAAFEHACEDYYSSEIIAEAMKYAELDREEFIQSLSTQQLPKEFIPLVETVTKGTNEFDFYEEGVIKTITNSEGKQEIQGKYIW